MSFIMLIGTQEIEYWFLYNEISYQSIIRHGGNRDANKKMLYPLAQ
jgi:hypothetical protein